MSPLARAAAAALLFARVALPLPLPLPQAAPPLEAEEASLLRLPRVSLSVLLLRSTPYLPFQR